VFTSFRYLYQRLFSPKLDLDSFVPTELTPYCILFGSSIWGGFTPKSDIDLLAHENDTISIEAALNNLNIAFSYKKEPYTYITKNINFTLNNTPYNISLVEDRAHDIYTLIIPIMTHFSQEHPQCIKKRYRVHQFTYLYDYIKYKSSLPTDMKNFLSTYYPELLL